MMEKDIYTMEPEEIYSLGFGKGYKEAWGNITGDEDRNINGATYFEKIMWLAYESIQAATKIIKRDDHAISKCCGAGVRIVYCESGLYWAQCADCGKITLAKSHSFREALEKVAYLELR